MAGSARAGACLDCGLYEAHIVGILLQGWGRKLNVSFAKRQLGTGYELGSCRRPRKGETSALSIAIMGIIQCYDPISEVGGLVG